MAVATYIKNSPVGVEHYVLVPFQADGSAPPAFAEVAAVLEPLGEGHVSRIRTISATAKRLRPSAVHAHSSFAGAYARIALRRRHHRIVYTPHCFSFERTDIGPVTQSAYRFVEWILGWNTSVLAACSGAEAAAGERMISTRGRVQFLPNLASIPSSTGDAWDGSSRLRVAMIGRLSPQKDPRYFADVIGRLRRHTDVNATWFGDGDTKHAVELESAGIDVAGWLPATELGQALSAVHVYIHTAAWEGFPISVLDAHALGRPILVREINAFSDLDSTALIREGLDSLVVSLSSAESFRAWAEKNRAVWRTYLEANTLADQRFALASIWGIEPPVGSTEPREQEDATRIGYHVD